MITIEQLKQRKADLEEARRVFVEQANLKAAAYDGGIAEMDNLIRTLEAEGAKQEDKPINVGADILKAAQDGLDAAAVLNGGKRHKEADAPDTASWKSFPGVSTETATG